METLKDIKDSLKDIPDEVLDNLYFGVGEGSEETVSLIYGDDNYYEIFEKYPQLGQLDNLIQNVKKAQDKMDEQGEDADNLNEALQQEGVTDTYFDKKIA